MGHVSISRFGHVNSNVEEVHGRIQALADSIASVNGVISSRTFLAHDTVILFTEIEDMATMDRIAADAGTKAVRVAMGDGGPLESAGFELWSGRSPSYIRE